MRTQRPRRAVDGSTSEMRSDFSNFPNASIRSECVNSDPRMQMLVASVYASWMRRSTAPVLADGPEEPLPVLVGLPVFLLDDFPPNMPPLVEPFRPLGEAS